MTTPGPNGPAEWSSELHVGSAENVKPDPPIRRSVADVTNAPVAVFTGSPASRVRFAAGPASGAAGHPQAAPPMVCPCGMAGTEPAAGWKG
jgi:hypothetical protein